MSNFAKVSKSISDSLKTHIATVDRDAEWQRVNTYIADVLKDAHVLYAKLARLQGDFGGQELDNLEKISEGVLGLGNKLSQFSKEFYEGKASMTLSEAWGEEEKPIFGNQSSGGMPFGAAPAEQQDFSDFDLNQSPAAEQSATQAASPTAEEEAEPVEMEFDYGQD